MKAQERGDKVLINTYGHFPVCIERGEGVWMYDDEGKKYLDFVAGIAVNSLGSAHPRLVKAIADQAENLIHCSNLYYTDQQLKLAEMLTENTDFDRVFFCNSGAEAIEGALKLCRKYAALKDPEKTQIIAMENSFHGRTYGSLTVTAQPKYQKNFGPMVPDVLYSPYNDFEALASKVTDKTAAILMEVIQGEGGITPADVDFLKKTRALCDEKDIVLVFDEIQSGVGRTGDLYAYMTVGVVPDVITSAKGLAGGVPIGAVLAKEKVAEAFTPGDHGSTFGGNPLACSAGLVVLDELLNNGVLANAKEMGEFLGETLENLKAKHPDTIKEARGLGLMRGIELTCEPKEIINKCIERGLLLVSAGTNVIRFVPPLIVNDNQIAIMADILDDVLTEFETGSCEKESIHQ